MSQLSARSEIFLAEMGIATQWRLRNAPPAVRQEQAHAEPDEDADEAPPVPHHAPAVPSAQLLTDAIAPAAAAPAPAPAAPEPRAEAAWTDDNAAPAPAPVPAVPVQDDVPPADMAWFDVAPAPAPARAPEAPLSEQAIAAMDWPALQAAVASCTRCGLCASRRQAVAGRGAPDASWLAIATAPSQADEQEGRAISGEAGQLLDNMLKAISLSTQTNAYLATLVKCRPQTADGADRLPTADEVLACRPFLEREIALTGAGMALTFGQSAAKGLLGVAARGKLHHYGTLPVVATYHPDDLLRKPEDKAKAWADLCLARDARDVRD